MIMFRDFPDVLTVPQVAQALGIGIKAAYSLVNNHQILHLYILLLSFVLSVYAFIYFACSSLCCLLYSVDFLIIFSPNSIGSPES